MFSELSRIFVVSDDLEKSAMLLNRILFMYDRIPTDKLPVKPKPDVKRGVKGLPVSIAFPDPGLVYSRAVAESRRLTARGRNADSRRGVSYLAVAGGILAGDAPDDYGRWADRRGGECARRDVLRADD